MNTPLSFSAHALAQAVEQCPVSVVITDLDGTIQYVNPWFTKVTGYHRDEVIGGNPRILKSGYTTAEEYAAMFRELEAGVVWRGEFRNRRKSGEPYWEEAVIVPVSEPDGRITHYMALKEDVTARREAERAREGMIALLHLCNRASTRLGFMQSVAQYLRAFAEVESVVVRCGEGPWKEGVTQFSAESLNTAQACAETVSIPLRHAEHSLGRIDFLPAFGRVFSAVEQETWREMAETIAVTLAKYNSEEALRESELRYRDVQKMEAIGQLAGGIAHDYNNILTASLLHLALLREVPGMPTQALQTLDELEVEAKRAAKLTRQLLLFSRRQPGKVERLDLHAVAAGLLPMLQRVLGEDVSLAFPCGERGAWLEGDASMLEQVIMNLCINARDAMEPLGGLLTLRIERKVRSAEAPPPNPHARPGTFVCLQISDTGHGMDAVTKARIFEPFFTTKGEGRGTGLGLATVYSIVERHRGWVEVESSVGQGSTFHVFLPAAEPPAPGPEDPEVGRARYGKGELILLVEDDPVVRATSASVLRHHGFQVLDAPDVQKAWQLWAREGARIQLLLTDLVLPGGQGGKDLIEQCRAEKPSLPVIVTSGYSTKAGTDPSEMSGVSFIAKPYELAELARLVTQLIRTNAQRP